MTRVLLVAASTLERSPYIRIYTELLDANKVDYDIILWNRCGDKVLNEDSRVVIFEKRIQQNILGKTICFFEYIRFICKHIRSNKYSSVILFTIPLMLPLYKVLIKKKIPYICDIRDYSRLYRWYFIRLLTCNAISKSDFTSISSAGFLEWLPKFNRYVISHNITREALSLSRLPICSQNYNDIKVLTIGQIRDYSANLKIIKYLSDNNNIRLFFIGGGAVSDSLKHYVHEYNITNVKFEGRYLKSHELDIVDKYDMINIFFDQDINSRTLMSNRFYLGLLLKKPMIVASGTYQADLVEKYSLGISISDITNISDQILKYWNSYINNVDQFVDSCNRLLSEIEQDINQFDIQLKEHLKINVEL